MSRPGEQQFGITNNFEERMAYHERFGWQRIDFLGPYPGSLIFDTEAALKKWLKVNIGAIPGTKENWETAKFEAHSISELFQRTGIHSDLL